MRQFIRFSMRQLCYLIIFLIGIGLLSSVHPAFDAVSNLRWHLSIMLAFYCVVLLIAGLYKTGLMAALVTVFGLFSTMPPQIASPNTPSPGRELSVLEFNMRFSNPRKKEVIQNLQATNPDILILAEVSKDWMPFLDTLEDQWPYQLVCPEISTAGGVAILSKYRVMPGSQFCYNLVSIGFGVIDVDGEKVAIGAVHLAWPWPGLAATELERIRVMLADLPKNAIVAGDFNAVPWSDIVSRFASYGGLVTDNASFGTWIYNFSGYLPSSLAVYIGFRIDHFMHKGNIELRSLKVLSDWGSDHLPQLAVYSISNIEDDK